MTRVIPLAATLLALIALGAVTSVVSMAYAQTAPAQKEELDALRARLDRLKRELSVAEGGRAEAADQLRDVERAISESNRGLRELATRSAAVRGELRALESGTRRAESDIDARSKDLSQLLYQRYLGGERDAARILLSGDDPHRIARELHYFGYISRAQGATIRELQADVAELKSVAERVREKAAELAALENRQRAGRTQLETERAEQRTLLSRLAGQIRTQRREIQNATRNEQRLTRLVESITRMLRERAEREKVARERAERAQRAERAARQRAEAAGKATRESKPASGGASGRSAEIPSAPNDKVPEAGEIGSVFSSFAALRGRLRLPVRGEIAERFGAARADGGPSWKGVFIRVAERAGRTRGRRRGAWCSPIGCAASAIC